MWPFTSGPRRDREKVLELEERVRKLERLELEWLEWYDKFRRLYARIAKRVEEARKLEPDDVPNEKPPEQGGREDVAAHSGLRFRHVNRGF